MPLSAGMALKNFLKASKPPADAPMPTMGHPETYVNAAASATASVSAVEDGTEFARSCWLSFSLWRTLGRRGAPVRGLDPNGSRLLVDLFLAMYISWLDSAVKGKFSFRR